MTSALNGLDSLLSTVQMPGGIPVGTFAIGKAGATNAALFAVAILANSRPELKEKLKALSRGADIAQAHFIHLEALADQYGWVA